MKKVLLYIIGVLLLMAIAVGIGYFFADKEKPEEGVVLEKRISRYALKTSENYNRYGDYVIDSMEEFFNFRNMYSDALYETLIEGYTIDDNFFKYAKLFVSVQQASSESIYIELKEVSFADNKVKFIAEENTPEEGTDDIATWYLAAVVTNDYLTDIDYSDWEKPSKVILEPAEQEEKSNS